MTISGHHRMSDIGDLLREIDGDRDGLGIACPG
jgi:hypothetical protein